MAFTTTTLSNPVGAAIYIDSDANATVEVIATSAKTARPRRTRPWPEVGEWLIARCGWSAAPCAVAQETRRSRADCGIRWVVCAANSGREELGKERARRRRGRSRHCRNLAHS